MHLEMGEEQKDVQGFEVQAMNLHDVKAASVEQLVHCFHHGHCHTAAACTFLWLNHPFCDLKYISHNLQRYRNRSEGLTSSALAKQAYLIRYFLMTVLHPPPKALAADSDYVILIDMSKHRSLSGSPSFGVEIPSAVINGALDAG